MENLEKQPGTHVVQSVRQSADQNQQSEKQPQKKVKPEQPTVRKRTINWWLGIFGILIVLTLTVIGFVEWQRRQFTDLQSQRESLVTNLPGETSVTQEQIDALSSGLLSEKDVVSFIETVEQASPSFDEFKISFVSDVPEGKKAPLYLPITFTMTGSFADITTFISSLLESQYVIKVDALELTSKDGFESSATLLLTARVYVADDFGK